MPPTCWIIKSRSEHRCLSLTGKAATGKRTRRAFGYTLVVSSGQELVTAAPSYLSYALDLPETRVIGLVLEAMRQPAELRHVLARAAQRDLPVVLLTAGSSASGQAMVAAHSGALAGSDGGWKPRTRPNFCVEERAPANPKLFSWRRPEGWKRRLR